MTHGKGWMGLSTLILLFGWGLTGQVEAATYHVNASLGNDSFPGTLAQPWKTFQQAGKMAVAGDTVYFFNGSYTAGWSFEDSLGRGGSLKNSGAPGAYIRFLAYPGQTAVTMNNSFIGLKRLQYIEISGFTLVGPLTQWLPTEMGTSVSSIVIDQPGMTIRYDPNTGANMSDVRQKYSTYMALTDSLGVTAGPLRWSAGITLLSCQNIRILNNNVSRYWSAVNLNGSSNTLIEKNDLWHCMNGVFIDANSADITVRDNDAHHNLSTGIDVKFSQRVIIEKNRCSFNGIEHIALHNDSHDCVIRGNDVRYGGHYCEAMGWPGGSALNVHQSGTGNVVEDNFAAYHFDLTGNDGNGIIIDRCVTNAQVLIRNNIFYRHMGSGIAITAANYASDTNLAVIVNNTAAENGYGQKVGSDNAAGLRFNGKGNKSHNNLLYKNYGSCVVAGDFRLQTSMNNNLYFPASGTPLIKWPVVNSLAAITAAKPGFETNGQQGDPALANPGASTLNPPNFSLTSGSLAVNKGDSSAPSVPSLDFAGALRAAPIDIGAYEFSGTIADTTPPNPPKNLRPR